MWYTIYTVGKGTDASPATKTKYQIQMKTTTITGWGNASIEATTITSDDRDFLEILLATGGAA